MASDSPNTEETYEQNEEFSTNNQEVHFPNNQEDIDPNAPTQIIDNNRSFEDEVSSRLKHYHVF